jgi:rhodanese-related sulfurtransferase
MIAFQEISALELAKRLQEPEPPLLLDVRAPNETQQGIIAGAQLLPLHLLPLQYASLPKDREIISYCRSGARSAQACMFLLNEGFQKVVNLRGGIMDWSRQGFPIAPCS